jgi:hypothetical protein
MLSRKLNQARTRQQVVTLLKGQQLKTSYYDRNGERKSIKIDAITMEGANRIKALGNLSAPYNFTVEQFFLLRHDIHLKFPYLPCAVMDSIFGKQYYPLELLIFDCSYLSLPNDSPTRIAREAEMASFELEVIKFLQKLEDERNAQFSGYNDDDDSTEEEEEEEEV